MTRVAMTGAAILQCLKDTERRLDTEAIQLVKQINALSAQIRSLEERLEAIDKQQRDIYLSRQNLCH